jgi:DNA-binding MarR family transcriptional regulator
MTDYYSVDSMEAANSVGYLIKRCGILMTQIAEQRFESQPVTFTQWIVLMQLNKQPHLSPTELSAHLGHDMGALTRVVDDLHRKRLVLRERSEQDRRGVQITLTQEGRRVAQAAKTAVVELINELVEPYTKAETDQLIALLQRMVVHMQDVVGAPTTEESLGLAAKAASSRRATRKPAALHKPSHRARRTTS